MEDRQPPHFRCQGPREALVVWIASSVKITALRSEGSVPPKPGAVPHHDGVSRREPAKRGMTEHPVGSLEGSAGTENLGNRADRIGGR